MYSWVMSVRREKEEDEGTKSVKDSKGNLIQGTG